MGSFGSKPNEPVPTAPQLLATQPREEGINGLDETLLSQDGTSKRTSQVIELLSGVIPVEALIGIVLDYEIDLIEGMYAGTLGLEEDETQITADGRFDCPYGITSNNSHIFVADGHNNRIQVFDKKGTFVRKFGSEGTADGQFQWPYHLAYEDNELFISDFNNKRLQVFSVFGKFKRKFVLGYLPTGVAVGDNLCFISNLSTHKICVYTKEGQFLYNFGSFGFDHGKLFSPYGLCYEQSELYVADSANRRIEVFHKNGNWIKTIGKQERSGLGYLIEPGVLVLCGERLYVGDDGRSDVQVFNKDTGEYVRTIGKQGDVFKQNILGLMILDRKLYASDTENNRILLFV